MATAWGNTAGTSRGEDILVSGLTAAGTYVSIGVLVDLDANTTSVLVGASAAPSATRSISGVTGAKFPMFAALNGDICEANFGATAFERPLPAGYSAWGSTCTWNPADKDASITLSGGDLIATGTASNAWRGVRGTTSNVTSGKWYFEVKVRLNTGLGNFLIGIGNASAVTNNYFSVNANGASWQSNGNFGTNNSFTGGACPVFDEYSNTWRTIRSDVSHNGGHWYVEVLINALSSAGAGVIAGVMNSLGPLRNYLGSDAAGNSAGFQANRSYIRANSVTGNVLPAAVTATHVLGLDINLDANPPTIAGRLDGGTWSAAQSIASVFPLPAFSAPTDIYLAVSLNDAPSTYDSVTVNFGATAFTYTAPTGAVGWDTTFGSTLGSVSGVFVESMFVSPSSDVQISGIIAETMYAPGAEVAVSSMYVEALRSAASGVDTSGSVSGMFVEVLRTATTNPVYQVGMFVDVMFQSPAAEIRNAGMFVEVLRVSELPPPGARGFNRAVTIIT